MLRKGYSPEDELQWDNSRMAIEDRLPLPVSQLAQLMKGKMSWKRCG